MTTWTDLPSEIRKIVIYMGKEICTHELLEHVKLFRYCLYDIKQHSCVKNRVIRVIRYWLRSENTSRINY